MAVSPWVPVVSAGFFAALTIAERFYSRLVPDLSDPKRHLRRAGWIMFYGLSLGSTIWGFWIISKERGPVTPELVPLVGGLYFELTLLVFVLVLQLARDALENFGRLMKLDYEHVSMTGELARILDVLVSKTDGPDETKARTQAVLRQIYGKREETVSLSSAGAQPGETDAKSEVSFTVTGTQQLPK